MGNLLSCTGLSRSLSRDDVVKLVHSNGLVEEFYRSVRVAELSVDYPQHSICNSGDLRQMRSGRLRKLSEEDSMELGQIYFLLPSKLFELPLAQADVAALFLKAGVARKASYKDLVVSMQQQVKPFAMLELGEVNMQQEVKVPQKPDVKLSRELIQKLIEETRLKLETQMKLKPGAVVNTSAHARGQARLSELQTAYAHHMLARSCTKLWRPLLETIKEDPCTMP
ncbi:hypothetical protein GOP47_0009241 [Adiantum capillus-veneris]|uniref:Uncharacterized protein n=1 Tax=Adiantum capillus-veneris TaxID=13818 RepID=A0A9D4UVV0_ADICA|nr:hypothetical protein GOP47_0009241 [Adiantum capillus-veneris]